MEFEPMPKVVPIRPDVEVEQRAWQKLYGKDWELPPGLEERRSSWLGALLLIAAFVLGGLVFAVLLRCAV